jgi:integrase
MLLAVRAFYLDLQHWAMEQPELWAQWSAPCPISEADLRGTVKEKRRRQARMHQRTRTLAPLLPRVVAVADGQLDRASRILTAARATVPGEEFTVDGARFLRTGKPTKYWQPTALLVRPVEPSGPRFDAAVEEDQAFWVWAAVEVLRRTGARIEEMLELTHLSLRQYQAPTGDMVPLLQISPSNPDHERVIPADPELVAVLARIIRRVKDRDGRVPLLQRYDFHDRRFGPPLPHLFQRASLGRLAVISPTYFNQLFKKLAAKAALTDVDGSLISFSAHDFRRVFATETVNSGLPIHIAAKLLGHLDLNTTQGYVAVYPEEVIRHYRAYIDQGRGRRPREDYREPTDAEWTEFRDHFQLRKVALGTCDRPYGTPCQHEHACIRCPMLRLDLAQVPRLLQIETNTHERLDEARRMQWLGEVAALEESLRHIANKKQQADRLRRQAEQAERPAPPPLPEPLSRRAAETSVEPQQPGLVLTEDRTDLLNQVVELGGAVAARPAIRSGGLSLKPGREVGPRTDTQPLVRVVDQSQVSGHPLPDIAASQQPVTGEPDMRRVARAE